MPKKKGGKKGAKIVDGIATSEMSRDQLVGHVRRIQVELDREREERNFFMLEREKLFALWNIAMEQLHAQKIKTRLAVEQMTEHDEQKQMEVMMHKQKLRFLLTEQSKRVDEARLQNLKKLRKAQEDMLRVQNTLKESVDQKSDELRSAQNAMHELLRQMKLENAKNVSKVRDEACLEIARVERDFLTAAVERERKDYVALENEREIVKNKHLDHVNALKDIHGNAMVNTTSYFHQITINNLATIAALQQELKEIREEETKVLVQLTRTQVEMANLEERIRKDMEERKKESKGECKVTNGIRKELKKMREMQGTKDKYTRSVEVANEALVQKMDVMERECRAFKQTVTKAILDMQQEATLKRMVLELKLQAATSKQQDLILKPIPMIRHSINIPRNEEQDKDAKK